MAENINSVDLFGSGGHLWVWQGRQVARKILQTVGTRGAARMVTALPPLVCMIDGFGGAAAVLKGSGLSRALADAALDAVESPIVALEASGAAKAWEDDQAHSGTALVIDEYMPLGHREYATQTAGAVTTHYALQRYRCRLIDLSGGWD